jgi:hypothetical protein
MALFDKIFPSQRDDGLVQNQWADGWLNGASGFGYAAEYLTESRKAFGATIGQVGLAVFFLQRHRAEMILKGLLNFAGAAATDKHGLVYLWDRCREVLKPLDATAWQQFATAPSG